MPAQSLGLRTGLEERLDFSGQLFGQRDQQQAKIDLRPLLSDGSLDPNPRPGGRLQLFQAAWDRLGDPYASSVVRHGAVPSLISSIPPRLPRSRRELSPGPMRDAMVQMMKSLHEDLVIEALETGVPPPDSSPYPTVSLYMPAVVHPWYHTYFMIPKTAAGAYRGISDLRGLNDYVDKEKFKMDTLRTRKELVRPGDYMTSLDIQSAYPHLKISRRFRNLFCFAPGVTEQEVFGHGLAPGSDGSDELHCRFRNLPFGLRSAPKIWTRLCRAAISALRRPQPGAPNGIRCTIYLDDLAIAASSVEESLRHTRMGVKNVLSDLSELLLGPLGHSLGHVLSELVSQ